MLAAAIGPAPPTPVERPARGGSALLGALLVLVTGLAVEGLGLVALGEGRSASIRTGLVAGVVVGGATYVFGQVPVRILDHRRRRLVAGLAGCAFFIASLGAIDAALDGWVDLGGRSLGPVVSALVAGIAWALVPRSSRT